MTKSIKLTYFTVITSLLLSPTVLAKEENLADRVQDCVKITQDTERLTCFDQLTSKRSAVIVEPEITDLTAEQVDTFSKGQVKKTTEELANQINSITLTISKLSKTPYGQWKITFENGQKWQQKDSYKLSLKTGQRVVLTKGAITSVFLQKENTNKRIKVKRLK
ncbi:hypothetical protein [Colwellia psychrerythraea]|uniref:Lipoprotein n=1 Tax=Colwellia psychrerythraea (strain 34H / ATCC BAA-681) TaxID=167879 RepID=Q48AH9_COLP3|nr:hypothetical protein [Colwellia psychrerythraea]AAZ25915.1 hypothetical protein CPS_0166 [Colwellia psychrerythraea 34H]